MAEEGRTGLEKALDSLTTDEFLRDLVKNNLAQTKRVWVEGHKCKHCGRGEKFQVEIPDAKATAQALELLWNQAKGRPDVAREEEQDRIVFERVVYLTDDVSGTPV